MSANRSGKSRNLTTTLAMGFALMSMAALIISGMFGIFFLFQIQQEAIAGKQQLVAHQAAAAVSGFVQEKFSLMDAAVRLTSSLEERQRAVQVLLGLQPAFRQLLLLNVHNQVRFRVSRMSQTESARLDRQLDSDPFSRVKDNRRHIGSVYVDQVTSEPLIILSVPVVTVLGKMEGVLVAEVNLKFMWDLVDQLKVGGSGLTYVVDRMGRLIAFGEIGRVLKGERMAELKDVSDFMTHPGHKDDTGVNIFSGIDGRMVVGTYVPLIEPDWAVMTELPVRDAYQPLIRSAVASAGILLAMAILAAWLGVGVARRLAIPILNLADTASRIEAGGLELQAAMVGPTEVVRLASAFNNMTNRLRIMLISQEERSRKLAQEVLKRKKAQDALRESSSVLVATFESIQDGVLVVTGNGKTSHYNSRFAELWSIPEDVLDTGNDASMIDYVSSQLVDPEGFTTKINALYQSANISEDTLYFKDGRIVERFSYPLLQDGRETGRAWFFRDVTERRKAVVELRQLRNYLANIINSMPSVLVGVDNAGRVTQWNRQAERLSGLSVEKAQAKPLADVFPRLKGQMQRIQQAILNREVLRDSRIPYQQQDETRFEDITIFPLTANGVEGVVIRVDDVTERVRLEEMMIQSEKMLSIGGLAAGMAHEVNNPLAGIMQSATVLKNRLLGDLPANRRAAELAGTTMATIRKYLELRKLPGMLDSIDDSGKRAASIVKNMLSFARKSNRVITDQDLRALLDQTIDLVQTDYDIKKHYDFRNIRIDRQYDAAVVPVPCDPGKLQQVFLNILKNGAEAMAETMHRRQPPTFTLRVREDGEWVRVEIEDNGPGMDDKTRRSIFDPFFTTKPVGKGTGLGLSVSYFIITEDHGGELGAYAVDSGGTRFVIRLPKAGISGG